MDWNSALLLLTAFSCASLLWRSMRRHGRKLVGWLAVGVFVSLASAIAWITSPHSAGFFGFALWSALVLLPTLLWRQSLKLAIAQQFSNSFTFARIASLLHPFDTWPEETKILLALSRWQQGDADAALATLTDLAARGGRIGFEAECHRLRIEGRWSDLANWITQAGDESALADYPLLVGIYLRSLGEIGNPNAMLEAYARIVPQMRSPSFAAARNSAMMFPLIFGGRRAAVEILLNRQRPPFTQSARDFWLATASLAAGDSSGRDILQKIAAIPALPIAAAARHRLDVPPAPASDLTPHARIILNHLEYEVLLEPESIPIHRRWQLAPMTAALIAINVAVFILEIAMGGSMSDEALSKLGALDFDLLVTGHQYWRILAASFLHFGWAHLLFNMAALFVLGPGMERALAKARFLAVYFTSAIGSMLGVMMLQYFNLIHRDEIVGASGAIMGLVGASGAVLLKQWLLRKDADVRRRLINVISIIALQAFIDTMSPQVSSSAHLFGAGIGFAAGFLLFRSRPKLRIAR